LETRDAGDEVMGRNN